MIERRRVKMMQKYDSRYKTRHLRNATTSHSTTTSDVDPHTLWACTHDLSNFFKPFYQHKLGQFQKNQNANPSQKIFDGQIFDFSKIWDPAMPHSKCWWRPRGSTCAAGMWRCEHLMTRWLQSICIFVLEIFRIIIIILPDPTSTFSMLISGHRAYCTASC